MFFISIRGRYNSYILAKGGRFVNTYSINKGTDKPELMTYEQACQLKVAMLLENTKLDIQIGEILVKYNKTHEMPATIQ